LGDSQSLTDAFSKKRSADRLKHRARKARLGLIYLDSCILIYLVENHPVWSQRVQARLAQEIAGAFAISPLVKLECLVKPMQTGDLALQKRYQSAFEELTSLNMTEEVFLQAAQLRSRFGIKTPDALHLACAQANNCSFLWTNDNRLAQASCGLAIAL
jgi:uncharacterized protein